MATIKSQMVLNDGMSVVLKKITSALDTTLSSFEMVQRASGSAVDVANIEAARAQLADASRAVDDMADNYRRAAQEEERLNDSINRGASAMDGMVTKVVSLVGAYMSLSAIKNLATTSMDAANTQINAQVQLRTVLENMGAMDSYEALTNEVSGNELENDLTLNTAGALDNYDTFAAEVTGNTLEAELVVQADNSQALTAYDAIVQKAADIQGNGIYGDEIMIAGAAEFATYFEDANAILSMMDTLTDYAMGMSGGGALDATSMVDYATGLGKIMSGSYDAMTKKGFEFSDAQKAIIEGTATEAQIVAELGAEYLNMSSDMQAAAAINNVIAEGWGGLYETMSNTPEGKIISLNNTLGDIQEVVGAGIYPAVTNLVDTVQQNAPQIETAALGLATVLGTIINIISLLIDGALSFGTVVAENWSWIEPIIWGGGGGAHCLQCHPGDCVAHHPQGHCRQGCPRCCKRRRNPCYTGPHCRSGRPQRRHGGLPHHLDCGGRHRPHSGPCGPVQLDCKDHRRCTNRLWRYYRRHQCGHAVFRKPGPDRGQHRPGYLERSGGLLLQHRHGFPQRHRQCAGVVFRPAVHRFDGGGGYLRRPQ